MEIRTYTNLWTIEKRMYRFYDMNLPYPVSLRQLGLFICSFFPWLFLMSKIGVPFAPPFGHLVWLAPPVAFVWYANRPVAEGKKLFQYAFSQIRFFFSPRNYHDLSSYSPKKEEKSLALESQVWSQAGKWSNRQPTL